jgi:hypothetical protein
MDINLYALEKQVEARLRDAREARARAALVSSLRIGARARSAVVAAVVARWTGRRAMRRVPAGASGAQRDHGLRLLGSGAGHE